MKRKPLSELTIDELKEKLDFDPLNIEFANQEQPSLFQEVSERTALLWKTMSDLRLQARHQEELVKVEIARANIDIRQRYEKKPPEDQINAMALVEPNVESARALQHQLEKDFLVAQAAHMQYADLRNSFDQRKDSIKIQASALRSEFANY